MQYKKEELKAVIIEKAENEFLNKGYEAASLRVIAKESGTTIGNLYHYFANKEALFDELVKNEYIAFLYLMEHHSDIEIPDDIPDKNDIHLWRKLIYDFLGGMMPVFTKGFLIMIEMSSDTKYQNTKNEFISIMESHFNNHISESGIQASPEFARVIAVQILSGILYVIRQYNDEALKRQLICDSMLYSICGLMYMLEA